MEPPTDCESNMSAEFVAALTEAFHKFDSNNDGRLSEQELKDVSNPQLKGIVEHRSPLRGITHYSQLYECVII